MNTPAEWQMPWASTPDPPPPVFVSWEDYLARTSCAQRMKLCQSKARVANRARLMSSASAVKVRGQDVWQILKEAQGRCYHCGSLAVENRPSNPADGAPLLWAQVGRRIGSLEHLQARVGGGDNDRKNLVWACLWCNTWKSERRPQATDHGGHHPPPAKPGPDHKCSRCEPKAPRRIRCDMCCDLFPPDDLDYLDDNNELVCTDCRDDANDYGFEMFPDHEGGGRDTAMWRDTFGKGR